MAGSRPSSTSMVPAPGDTQYSTLEVDHNCWLENDRKAALIVDQDHKDEKILSDHDVGKAALIVGQDPKDEKILSYSDDGKQAVVTDGHNAPAESTRPTEERKIFGLKRRTFFILLPVVLIVIIAAAVGGGVGGSRAARNRKQTDNASSTTPQTPATTRGRYANTGLAAMQWTDLNGTLHKRLYYQDNNKVRESAWDNDTAFDTAWKVNVISDAVKPATPIAAVAGYPHASYNYSLASIAYLLFPTIG